MASSKKRKGKSEDEAQAAVRVMETIAEKSEADSEPVITDEMRKAAAAFGRIGGKIGGVRRAAKLSAKKRAEIAKKAAAARWRKD